MGDRSAPKLKRYLPHVVVATAVVIVLPIALVAPLVRAGAVTSLFISGPLAMAISLGASSVGSAWWKKRPGAHDLVFSDLMLWGWLRRLRTEHRLSRAVELLGSKSELPTAQQVAYFEALAHALEARDPYTHGHTRRVTAHSVAIAERMGLSQAQIAKVRTAAAIHDIGKLNTPREVLNKPGRLTDEEFAVIKRHPVDGAEMAARLGDDEITAMVMHHHERLDGTGYPDRLAGEQIPLGARIIAVADTFDAITSKRPYRGASSHKKGMAILVKEAGTQLDPDAVRAFRSHYSGLRGVAVSSLLTSAPGRLLPWPWGLTSAAPLAKSVAAIVAAGVLGSAAAGLAKPVTSGGSRHRAALVPGAAPRGVGLDAYASRTAPLPAAPSHAGSSMPGRRRSRTSTFAPGRTGSGRPGSAQPPVPSQGGSGAPTPGTPSGDGRSGGAASSSGGPSSTSSGSASSGGGSSSGRGGSPSSRGTTSTPAITISTPATTVSTPSVTLSTPLGTVKPPPVTVTIPSVPVTTPSVTVTTPSLHTPTVSLP